MKRIFPFFFLLFPISLFAQDWHWQNPLPQGNSLNDIHIFDENTAIVVGEAGTVLKTADGGTTWTALASGTTNGLFSVFFIDPATGWAVGEKGTILRTTNGGTDWTAQTSGTTHQLSCVFFTDPNTGWATGGRYSPSASTIRHTTNGGTTWTTQTGGTTDWLYGVFFTDASTGWAVGENGTIVHTTNGGTDWTFQIEGASRCLYSVYFTDANTGWAVGHTGSIRHTTNGGTTWTAQTSGTTDHLHSVFFTDANTGWVVGGRYSPSNGTILQTTNGGTLWTAQTSGTTNPLYSAFCTDASTIWAVGDAGTILHSTNGGTLWTPQTRGTTNWLFPVFFIDASRGWAVGDRGTILHTMDGGTTWTAQNSGTGRDLSSVIFTDASTGWAVGALGIILHTTNDGGTWADQASGTTNDLSSIFFADANSGWAVGTAGTILHTTNGGTDWSAQTSGTTFDLSSVFFADANSGWTVGGRYSPSGSTILHTSDGGATWTAQTSGTTNLLSSVFFADASTGWAVGDVGTILHTVNGGTDWTAETSGTTNELYSIFFADPNTGWAVGDTGAILRTTNAGTDWTAQTSGTTNSLCSVLFTDANTGWAVGSSGTILHTTTGGTGVEPPAAPALASPEDGSIVATSPLLSWNPAAGANWYSVQVSVSPWFTTLVLNQTNIATASYQLSGLEDGTIYYWRVSLTDDTGTSGWSEAWSFGIGSAPQQLALVAPGDGALVTSDSAVFVWHQGFPLVDHYWFEEATDSLFSTPFIDSLVTDTVRTLTQLSHNQTYWWRVRAHNIFGVGPFSEARSFFVYLEIPSSPALLSPDNGATGVSTNLTLGWSSSTGSESFAVQLSDAPDFSSLIVDADSLGATSFDVAGLSVNTTYYWRARAVNALGASDWSEVWSFTTWTRPNQVVLATPEDGAILADISAVCRWFPSTPDVDRYWFEWADNSAFTGSSVDSAGTDTISIASPLQNNQTYYWRVRGHNDAGWGEFSEVWSFAVVITSVGDEEQIPAVYSLNQNYPNPFNPSTTIRYGLAQQTHVMLEVFNMLGQRVTVLVDEGQEAGYHTVKFDAAILASGLYVYRLQAGDFVETRKLVLLK